MIVEEASGSRQLSSLLSGPGVEPAGSSVALKPPSAGGSRHFSKPHKLAGHPVEQPTVAFDVLHPVLDVEFEALERRSKLMGEVTVLARPDLASGQFVEAGKGTSNRKTPLVAGSTSRLRGVAMEYKG